MQYELRTQVVEPSRKTFDNLVARYGDRPASRYEEGSIDVQAKENFHYRPTWAPDKDIYDEAFSAFRLTDPYSFLDPRQYYYAPYVTSRAALFDGFGTTLEYIEGRRLFERMPQAWRDLVGSIVVPLRHYESGAQLVNVGVARFGFGTTITQCAAYASFDRIGNAQSLSRLGISLGGGTAELLPVAKTAWLEADSMQGLRKAIEQIICDDDWGVSLVRLDTVDRLLYRMLTVDLDDAALDAGAGGYSLVAQHLSTWFADHTRWLDALYAAWTTDPQHGAANAQLLATTRSAAIDEALAALTPLAQEADRLVGSSCAQALTDAAAQLRPADLAPATA